MIGCGTTIFTDLDDFRVNLRGLAVDLVLTSRERFRARLTWLRMARLNVVQIEESAPRIAHLSLGAGSTFVSFPLGGEPQMVWNGAALKPGQFVFHSEGDRLHQRLMGTARWGMAWLPRATLVTHGRALLGADLALPVTQIVHAPSNAIQRFSRLHLQACRLAQSRPDVASHPEAMHALEQELVHALVHAMAANVPQDADLKRHHHAEVLSRFESVLASRPDRPPALAELSMATGVSERTLRMRCAEFLGMSPLAYARLRRLNLARWTLLRADSQTASVATVARHYGFSELGRFAAAYRAVFGESPSATLRGAVSRGQGAAALGVVR